MCLCISSFECVFVYLSCLAPLTLSHVPVCVCVCVCVCVQAALGRHACGAACMGALGFVPAADGVGYAYPPIGDADEDTLRLVALATAREYLLGMCG